MLASNQDCNDTLFEALLTPTEAYQIDNKVDDGTANTGKTRGAAGHIVGDCSPGLTCASSGTYALSNSSTKACYIYSIVE